MILLELAAGSAVLPVAASHPAAGQGALHGTTVQVGGHLGMADSGTQGFPPAQPKLMASMAGAVTIDDVASGTVVYSPPVLVPTFLLPDFSPPRPKLLLPGFDAAGGTLQLALSFQTQGLPGAMQSTGHLQGPDLPQPPPKK